MGRLLRPALDRVHVDEVQAPANALHPALKSISSSFSREPKVLQSHLPRLGTDQVGHSIAPTNRNTLAIKFPLNRINSDTLVLPLQSKCSLAIDTVHVQILFRSDDRNQVHGRTVGDEVGVDWMK